MFSACCLRAEYPSLLIWFQLCVTCIVELPMNNKGYQLKGLDIYSELLQMHVPLCAARTKEEVGDMTGQTQVHQGIQFSGVRPVH